MDANVKCYFMLFMNHAESRTRVHNHADAYDSPEYESVKSPISKTFDIPAAGVPQAVATTTFTRQPCCKTDDHLQLVTFAMQ